MKYIKKINLIDTTDNKNIKKTTEESYHKGEIYYEKIEENQKSSNQHN